VQLDVFGTAKFGWGVCAGPTGATVPARTWAGMELQGNDDVELGARGLVSSNLTRRKMSFCVPASHQRSSSILLPQFQIIVV
jgi:hypothetical protein